MHAYMAYYVCGIHARIVYFFILYTPPQPTTIHTFIMSDTDSHKKLDAHQDHAANHAAFQGAPLRKMPTAHEIVLNILVNVTLFIISLYLIWIYYGWSASYSSTYVTVYADVKTAQSRVDAAKKAAAANPKASKNPTADAYATCLTYGWLMLPKPINDAYGYTNFWIQYNLARHIKPGLSLYGYNEWVKLLS